MKRGGEQGNSGRIGGDRHGAVWRGGNQIEKGGKKAGIGVSWEERRERVSWIVREVEMSVSTARLAYVRGSELSS
ncbi:hypothetical protein QQ045_004343 [Rhodiola kirilowii]